MAARLRRSGYWGRSDLIGSGTSCSTARRSAPSPMANLDRAGRIRHPYGVCRTQAVVKPVRTFTVELSGSSSSSSPPPTEDARW